MKTQQIMIREFSGLSIRQNHKTKMFNANDLANVFPNKNLSDYFSSKNTQLRVKTVMERESLSKEDVIFSSGRKRGEYSGTWVHPYIAMDLAMWLSPDFWYDAIKWVYDNLCDFRDSVGDNHMLMCDAVYEVLKPTDGFVYANETMMVQELAGIQKGKRNDATEEQLSLLNRLQKWNSKLIRIGISNIVTRRARLIEFKAMNED